MVGRGRLRVGKGQGQLGVGRVGTVGPDGVVVGLSDGFGGVFRSVGFDVGSCRIVGFGALDGTVLGFALGALGLVLGTVVGPALPGSLGSLPGLVVAGPAVFGGLGLSHFGHATVVC
jgi:hypothetical protein